MANRTPAQLDKNTLALEQQQRDAVLKNKVLATEPKALEGYQKKYRSINQLQREGFEVHNKLFDAYAKKRHDALEALVDNSPALAASAQKNVIKTNFSQKLGSSPEFDKAKQDFNGAVKALSDLWRNKEFSNEDLADTIKNKKDKAIEALKKQQEKDLKKAEELFTKEPLVSLAAADAQAFKKETLDKLAETHKAQLQSFETSVQGTISYLQGIRKQEYNQEALALFREEGSLEMKQAIERKLPPRPLKMGAHLTDKDLFISLDGIDINELKDSQGNDFFDPLESEKKSWTDAFLEKLIGLKCSKTKNPDGSWDFSIDNSRWAFLDDTPFDQSNVVLLKCISIAELIRASGCEKIILKATSKNEENALKLARIQYEAAARVGFDLSKIEIDVCGKTKKAEEIFAEFPKRLQKIQKQNKEKRDLKEQYIGPNKAADADKEQKKIEERVNQALEAEANASVSPR